MKKKAKMLLAALCAAVLTGSAVAAPVCAAETEKHYVLGDVDMNGKVELADAKDVLKEFTNVTLFSEERTITGEQFALAKVDSERVELSLVDAVRILEYYAWKTLEQDDTVNWKTLRGEEYFTNRIATCDRGDYTLTFDEAVGDYVIVKKG